MSFFALCFLFHNSLRLASTEAFTRPPPVSNAHLGDMTICTLAGIHVLYRITSLTLHFISVYVLST